MMAPASVASGHDAPFWEAARAGRLLLQRCAATGMFQWYPCGHSLATGSANVEWIGSAGLGVLHSFSVVRRSFFANVEAPYVLAIVDLDEGVRITTHVVGVEPAIGLRIQVGFRTGSEPDALPTLICEPG